MLFLRSSSKRDHRTPGLLARRRRNFQGGFLLDDEKVRPIYERGELWNAYNQRSVAVFLSELGTLRGGRSDPVAAGRYENHLGGHR